MDIIRFKDVGFSWGKELILENINFTVKQGEVFTLLGPSGCGKSTILRLISGLSRPSSGDVSIYGKQAWQYRGRDRCVATVWQSKALFPHLNVRKNIEFGLRTQRIDPDEISFRVNKVASQLALDGKMDRSISQLSGGEKQRVALARSIVIRPKILLLDEPFTGLDLALKQQLQADLRNLQEDYNCTYIMVSHLLEDVLSLASRIAIIQNKTILQVGDPQNLYHLPRSSFVARLVGKKNLIKSIVRNVERRGDEAYVSSIKNEGNWKAKNRLDLHLNENDRVFYVIAADAINLDGMGDCSLEANFRTLEVDGRRLTYYFRLSSGHEIRVESYNNNSRSLQAYSRGERVKLYWQSNDTLLLKQ